VFYLLREGLITPIGVATPLDDLLTIHRVLGDERAEKIIREIAVLSEGIVGACDYPARLRVLRKAAIHGTISQAERLGVARREALERGEDPAVAVVRAGNGLLCFQGILKKQGCQLAIGFMVGEITLRGIDADSGSSYRIRYKNDNIISWRDNQIDVTVRDLWSSCDGSEVLQLWCTIQFNHPEDKLKVLVIDPTTVVQL